MATSENKVKYNLKNVYYALVTFDDAGKPTFGTPVHWPGAVSLSLAAQGSMKQFYADGLIYWVSTSNQGYQGDLETALVPLSFRRDILGDTEDGTAKVMTENVNNKVSSFALLFEFDGDAHAVRHVMYNCTPTRPSVASKTTADTIDPSTETLTITAAPLADGTVRSYTHAETTQTVYDGWYSKVWLKGTAA